MSSRGQSIDTGRRQEITIDGDDGAKRCSNKWWQRDHGPSRSGQCRRQSRPLPPRGRRVGAQQSRLEASLPMGSPSTTTAMQWDLSKKRRHHCNRRWGLVQCRLKVLYSTTTMAADSVQYIYNHAQSRTRSVPSMLDSRRLGHCRIDKQSGQAAADEIAKCLKHFSCPVVRSIPQAGKLVVEWLCTRNDHRPGQHWTYQCVCGLSPSNPVRWRVEHDSPRLQALNAWSEISTAAGSNGSLIKAGVLYSWVAVGVQLDVPQRTSRGREERWRLCNATYPPTATSSRKRESSHFQLVYRQRHGQIYALYGPVDSAVDVSAVFSWRSINGLDRARNALTAISEQWAKPSTVTAGQPLGSDPGQINPVQQETPMSLP